MFSHLFCKTSSVNRILNSGPIELFVLRLDQVGTGVDSIDREIALRVVL